MNQNIIFLFRDLGSGLSIFGFTVFLPTPVQLKHRDGRLINDGVDLPVFVTTKEKPLPDRFLSKIPPEGNWVDGGRKVLSVSINLHSSLHVKGKLLHGFLSNPFEARVTTIFWPKNTDKGRKLLIRYFYQILHENIQIFHFCGRSLDY